MLKYEHLLGRTFSHGSQDCYGLVREFYRDNFNIELTDYTRPDDWWDEGLNLYMDHFHDEGFHVVDDHPAEWRPGDIILMSIRSTVANHAAILLEDGMLIHHMFGRLSELSSYRGVFRNNTVAVVRHKNVDYSPAETSVELMELIPDELRRQLTP